MATSGSGPASATARARAIGSLSMRTTPTSRPSSSSRTINDRSRCRSMATYCRSTGPLFGTGCVWRPRVFRSDRCSRERTQPPSPAYPLPRRPPRGRLGPSVGADPSARARHALCHRITCALSRPASSTQRGDSERYWAGLPPLRRLPRWVQLPTARTDQRRRPRVVGSGDPRDDKMRPLPAPQRGRQRLSLRY